MTCSRYVLRVVGHDDQFYPEQGASYLGYGRTTFDGAKLYMTEVGAKSARGQFNKYAKRYGAGYPTYEVVEVMVMVMLL